MSLHNRDIRQAALAAAILLAAAAVVALWIHPDPQGSATWFFALLPGAFAAPSLLEMEWRLLHRAGPIVMWSTVMVVSFLWYFVISYAGVKAYGALTVRSHTEQVRPQFPSNGRNG